MFCSSDLSSLVLFFNDTATIEIYTLSLHDALPIFSGCAVISKPALRSIASTQARLGIHQLVQSSAYRSEEHTSELQSHSDLVCRLLLEKKKPSPLMAMYPRQELIRSQVHPVQQTTT